jgi:hypothetical protein
MLSPSLLQANLVQNLLAAVLCLIAVFVSIRALYIYSQTQSPRLFILGVSMGVIALTAIADFYSSNETSITLNTDWFLYIGQAVSLLFILLSFLNNSDRYFQWLMRSQLLVSALLIGLLLLSPTLPSFPHTALQTLLSGSRCVICFGIFFFYISAYMAKRARFSLLMGIAFLLLGFGYLVLAQQYFASNSVSFDSAGDIIRMFGLIVLLAAILGN